jgi:SAM-dependent methyltransferase
LNILDNDPIAQLRIKWDERYSDPDKQPRVAEVLQENAHLLPAQGKALDLACGLGGNALFLAERGLEVIAWDLSSVAIERLCQLAKRADLFNLTATVCDVERQSLPSEYFDVIVVSYFLERQLILPLINALKPGGLIYYQTFVCDAVSSIGPQSSCFRLTDQELLSLFSPLKIRFYRDEARVGDTTLGSRDIAMLIAQRSTV